MTNNPTLQEKHLSYHYLTFKCLFYCKNQALGLSFNLLRLKKKEFIMKKNVGSTDRAIRIILGVILIVIGSFFLNWWAVLGLVFLTTGLFSWCPVYSAFGFSSDTGEKKAE